MRPSLRALIALCLVAGCARHYVEPRLDEPHALTRVRVVRHTWAGPQLDESVRLNDYVIAMPPAGPQPAVRALRVRPAPTLWRAQTTFFHTITVPVTETYTEQVACGTTYSTYGSSSVPQTRYCPQTRYRTVLQNRRVTDASCTGLIAHTPLAGAAYIVQFDFYGHEQCRLRCFRQLPNPDGTFVLVPCGVGEPPVSVASIAAPPPSAAYPRPGVAPPPPSAAPPPPATSGGAREELAAP